jgi:hypothetical protein
MKSLLLGSILFVTLIVPMVAARSQDPVRSIKRMLAFIVVFAAVYSLYVAFIHTAVFIPSRHR